MVTGGVIANNKKYVVIGDGGLVYDDGENTNISEHYPPFSHYREFPFYKKNILFGFIVEFYDVNKYTILSEKEEMNIMFELLIEDINKNFVSLPDGNFMGSDFLVAFNNLVKTDLFYTKESANQTIDALFAYLNSDSDYYGNGFDSLANIEDCFEDCFFKNGLNHLYWEDVKLQKKVEEVKVFKIAHYDENGLLVEDNRFYENTEDFIDNYKEKHGLDGSQIIKFEILPYTEILIKKNKYYELLN